jgi:SAM-dependent methyltransferase
MQSFVRHYILPLARKTGWREFCEIGARDGASTNCFLELPSIRYTVIDPCLDENLDAKYAADSRFRVIRSNSLDALPMSGPIASGTAFDCILIDGDHNWFTVFNELRLIHERELLRPGGFIFLHDVDWPYGRRDLYYQPHTIPAEFRQPFAQKGIVRGQSDLAEAGGLNAHMANAQRAGGPRNGVMTAIEDFLAQHRNDYRFFWIRYQWGLGVLQRRSTDRAAKASFRALRTKAFVYSAISRLYWNLRIAGRVSRETDPRFSFH